MPERILIIMRHAKSDWGEPEKSDFDRPLSARGLAAAPAMGRWLAGSHYLPDRIVTSPARRALHTAQLVKSELGKIAPVDLRLDARIYEAEKNELLAVLREQDARSLMLIGHNPGLTQLLEYLVRCDAAERPAIVVPTGAIFILGRDDTGESLAPRSLRLVARMIPKALPR